MVREGPRIVKKVPKRHFFGWYLGIKIAKLLMLVVLEKFALYSPHYYLTEGFYDKNTNTFINFRSRRRGFRVA